jgi:hypothetical protein
MKRLALACLALVLVTSGPAAPLPDTLTLANLANHPDLWPDTVILQRDYKFNNGAVAHQGDKVHVALFNGSQVLVIGAGNLRFTILPQDCGLLEAANQKWAALTPAQRGVTPESVAADMSLWPAKVAFTAPITSPFGRLPAGTEVSVVTITAKSVDIAWPNSPNRLNMDFGSTDTIDRARQLALLDPSQRPSRIAAALQGIMVDADGRPYRDDHLGDKKVFALYFGAGWCAPCHDFSPDFVKYLDGALPQHPELGVVFLSNDKQVQGMYAYMKEAQMPFPGVPPDVLVKSSILMGYSAQMIPQLVVVDRFGKVLACNDDHHGNRGDPKDTIGELDKLLKAQAGQ